MRRYSAIKDMKRKNEEQLIELAFGDITAGEAERLRQEISADPKASETLRTYEELRSSIGDLKDVPEMQLSRERLRHAILAGGLKESRKWNLQWLGAPVAIAAVAFAFTLVARRPALPLPAGQGLVATQNAGDVEIGGFDPTIERIEAPSKLFGGPGLGTITFDERPEPEVKPKSQVRVASNNRPWPAEKPKDAEVTVKPTTTSVVGDVVAPTVMAAAAAPTETTIDDDAIVYDTEVIVLTTEMNRDTGAQRATAMESGNNVLIGG